MFELLGEMRDGGTEEMREKRKEDESKDSQFPEFLQACKGTAGVLDCSRNVIVVKFPIDRARERESVK